MKSTIHTAQNTQHIHNYNPQLIITKSAGVWITMKTAHRGYSLTSFKGRGADAIRVFPEERYSKLSMNVGREQEVLVIAAVWGIVLMYTQRNTMYFVFTIRRTLRSIIPHTHTQTYSY